MSKTLINVGNRNLHLRCKVSDCWCIEGNPVPFLIEKLNNPDFPEWTGWRLVILWIALWFVFRIPAARLGGGGE
jgi:hypothetical protein